MNCPDCDSRLSSPDRCRCGWARHTETHHAILCSRCSATAMVKHKIGDEWVNFCLRCADAYRADEARAYCESKGLTSISAIKKWLKDQPLAKRIPIREPGADYEEDAA